MSVPKSKRTMSSVEFMEQAIQLRKHLTLYILSDFGVGGRKLNLTLYVQNQTCLTEENALNYKSWKCSLQKCFTNTYHAIREADRQFAVLFGTKAEVKQ